MIEFSQLNQLIKISEAGTISKAAEELFISQPALSRSMQKLEEELQVEIFIRHKNKVELSESGKLLLSYAKRLVEDYGVYIEHIRAFDRSQKTIAIGSCAPAPVWKIVPRLTEMHPEKVITSEIREGEHLLAGLFDGTYQIVITSAPIADARCKSQEYCREQLYLCVPKDHALSKKLDGITFAEMDGITMLLYDSIGMWKSVGEHLPKTRFILQSDRATFNDLAAESTLPYFSTNLSNELFGTNSNKVVLPILDIAAEHTFYVTVLKENLNLFSFLF